MFLLFPNIILECVSYPEEGSPPLMCLCKSTGLEPWLVRRTEVLGVCVYVVLTFHHPWNPGDLVMWGNKFLG